MVLEVDNLIGYLSKYGITNFVCSKKLGIFSCHQRPINVFVHDDMRSATYFATGLSVESQAPVVVISTNLCESRNAFCGLTEAYYRNIHVLYIAICQDGGLDYSSNLCDVANNSVTIDFSNRLDKGMIEFDEAIINFLYGNGPSWITVKNYGLNEFACKKPIAIIDDPQSFPIINDKSLAILVGDSCNADYYDYISEVSREHSIPVYAHLETNYKYQHNLINRNLSEYDLVICIGHMFKEINSCNEMWQIDKETVINNRITYYSNMDVKECLNDVLNGVNLNNKGVVLSGNINDNNDPRTLNICKLIYSLTEDDNLFVKNEIYSALTMPPHCRVYSYFNSDSEEGIISFGIGLSLVQQTGKTIVILHEKECLHDINALGNRHINGNLVLIIVANEKTDTIRNYGQDLGYYVNECTYNTVAENYENNVKNDRPTLMILK